MTVDINATKKRIKRWQEEIEELEKSIEILKIIKPDEDLSHIYQDIDSKQRAIKRARESLKWEADLLDAARYMRDCCLTIMEGKDVDWPAAYNIINRAILQYQGKLFKEKGENVATESDGEDRRSDPDQSDGSEKTHTDPTTGTSSSSSES